MKFAISLDVKMPLELSSTLRAKGKSAAMLYLQSDGGLVTVDLATSRPKVDYTAPSFDGSRLVLQDGNTIELSGKAGGSLGIAIETHIEVGVGLSGVAFATLHAQAQWAAKWGFDSQLQSSSVCHPASNLRPTLLLFAVCLPPAESMARSRMLGAAHELPPHSNGQGLRNDSISAAD